MVMGDTNILKYDPWFQINLLISSFMPICCSSSTWCISTHTYIHTNITLKYTHTHPYLRDDTSNKIWMWLKWRMHDQSSWSVLCALFMTSVLWAAPLNLLPDSEINSFIPDGCLPLWSSSQIPIVGKICSCTTLNSFSLSRQPKWSKHKVSPGLEFC